jgi:hypothetical protein
VPRRQVAVAHEADAADVERADEHHRERSGRRVEAADHALVARKEPRHRRRGRAVDAEQRAGQVVHRAQRAGERHVHAVVVVRREVDRRELPADERQRAVRAAEQLGERVAAVLRRQPRLHQPLALDRAALADRAVAGAGERERARRERARAGLERAGEERVEGRVAFRVGLGGLVEVDGIQAPKARHQRAAQRRVLAAREAVHQRRQEVLRQQVLDEDEEPPAGPHQPRFRPARMRR